MTTSNHTTTLALAALTGLAAVMIRSNQATTTQNGAGSIIIGLAEVGDERLRGLFEFDLSTIPAADQIDSVTLDLTTLTSSQGINNVGGPGRRPPGRRMARSQTKDWAPTRPGSRSSRSVARSIP